jgi:sugar O-acyltransferase (sialic acid O-acetyltransferase NeuD family)
MKNGMDIVIIGAGGHARVVADAARAAGFRLKGIVDINYRGQVEEILGCQVVGGPDLLNEFEPGKTAVAVAIGDCSQRADEYARVRDMGFCLPPVIHPTAMISPYARIGDGCFVNTGAVINAEAEIGENTIINSAAIIEHEVIIGKHCHICPGVKIGGRTAIGDHVFIGIGSSVIDYIKIGHDVIVGAGSVITKDVDPETTVVGAPGKRIK